VLKGNIIQNIPSNKFTFKLGSLPLGVVLDANVDKAINGCVAKSICSKKAVARDGRIQASDFFLNFLH
jgi:hypothetical protein